MFEELAQGFKFIKKNPAIIFSILLIITLPGFLFFISSILIKSYEKNFNLLTQSSAITQAKVISWPIIESLEDSKTLQKKVELFSQMTQEIKSLQIFKKSEGDSLLIVASSKKEEVGKKFSPEDEEKIRKNVEEMLKNPSKKKELQKEIENQKMKVQELSSLFKAYFNKQIIATLLKEDNEEFWQIYFPLKNIFKENEILGIIGLQYSIAQIQKTVHSEINKTYLFSLFGVFVVLILVLQHTRLFGYVDLAQKLQEIDRAKDSFLNMAVHELRSPIVAIRGYLEFLKNEIAPSPQAKEDFERIEISARRLNELIDDMLQVVRLEQGRLSFEPQIFSPIPILEEVVKELELKAKMKGLILKFEEKEEGKIKANPNRLKEVFVNLIDNAIKYTKKGYILVSAKVDKSHKKYYFIFEDTGIGISAENQKKLFQKFFRVQSKETADIPGTGLGLWIVKNIVEKMNGEIYLESIEGVGSKFKVIFPLVT
jgi:signal transduction histidine kinase